MCVCVCVCVCVREREEEYGDGEIVFDEPNQGLSLKPTLIISDCMANAKMIILLECTIIIIIMLRTLLMNFGH